MGFKGTKAEKKQHYDVKLCELLDEYTQVLVCHADNVGSTQLQGIRKGLRPDSVVLMGKNTMMKRSIRIHAEKTGNNAYLNLLPLLVVIMLSLFSLLFTFHLCGRNLVAFLGSSLDNHMNEIFLNSQFQGIGNQIENQIAYEFENLGIVLTRTS
jgi:ribosomal protein L10